MKAGILIRPGSLWIGVHWSPANRRLCINLVPCVTVWIVGAGGVAPSKPPASRRQLAMVTWR